MTTLNNCFLSDAPVQALDKREAAGLAANVLNNMTGMEVMPQSLVRALGALYFMGRSRGEKNMAVVSTRAEAGERFEGKHETPVWDGTKIHVLVGPCSKSNLAALKSVLPHLNPQVLGLKKSAGCGDRLGLATPGHIRSIRKTDIAPILPQQSVRENERTGRTPGEVMDDAVWGVFQEGLTKDFGADADHLKTTDDIDSFAKAGYTFFTIDPGIHLDSEADVDSPETLKGKFEELPWTELEASPDDLISSMVDKPFDIGNFNIVLSREELIRAAVKYGRAVAHTTRMYRHLAGIMGDRVFEFEMSVDETDSVTSLAEHVYLAVELQRLGIRLVSLAPRYLGDFEKGVDYIGDIKKFEEYFALHATAARALGPYKLSLHSGSDKFSIYPAAARLTRGLIHLKTAGTSYLEALRCISRFDPDLFRRILGFAIERYPKDRASYHVSAETSLIPDYKGFRDEALPELLEDFHAREVLHVTYGSVLNNTELKEPLFKALTDNEEDYTRTIESHFDRHFGLLTQNRLERGT